MANGLFIGRSTVDLLSYVNVFPKPDEKVKALADFIGGGGTALNAAIAYSYLGGKAVLCSCLGKEHLYKTIVINELKQYSVDVEDVCDDAGYTIPLSSIISVKSTASRTIINASQNECENVKKLPVSFFDGFDIIELDQYEWPFVKQHYNAIKVFRGPVILDGGTWKENTLEYLRLASIPIVSEEFVGGGVEEFADICNSLNIKQWAMTFGAKGIYYSDNKKIGLIPAEKIIAADTLGAGDIFHGAFCYYYSSGYNFFNALKKAGTVASKSCRTLGTREWMNE